MAAWPAAKLGTRCAEAGAGPAGAGSAARGKEPKGRPGREAGRRSGGGESPPESEPESASGGGGEERPDPKVRHAGPPKSGFCRSAPKTRGGPSVAEEGRGGVARAAPADLSRSGSAKRQMPGVGAANVECGSNLVWVLPPSKGRPTPGALRGVGAGRLEVPASPPAGRTGEVERERAPKVRGRRQKGGSPPPYGCSRAEARLGRDDASSSPWLRLALP